MKQESLVSCGLSSLQRPCDQAFLDEARAAMNAPKRMWYRMNDLDSTDS